MTTARHHRVANAPAEVGGDDTDGAPGREESAEEAIKAPWHFKILLVGTVGYLLYRLVWLIFWLTGHAWRG